MEIQGDQIIMPKITQLGKHMCDWNPALSEPKTFIV